MNIQLYGDASLKLDIGSVLDCTARTMCRVEDYFLPVDKHKYNCHVNRLLLFLRNFNSTSSKNNKFLFLSQLH